jgi:hypothetical protein
LNSFQIQQDGTADASTTMQSGSWSTGRKFGEAAPDIPDDDDETLAILPTNTCGAFVTALEDEFMCEFKFFGINQGFSCSSLRRLLVMFIGQESK